MRASGKTRNRLPRKRGIAGQDPIAKTWLCSSVNLIRNDAGVDVRDTTNHGKQVVDTGKMPWAIADAQITLTVANPGLTAATQLDINGNPRAKLKTTAQSQAGGSAAIAQGCPVRGARGEVR